MLCRIDQLSWSITVYYTWGLLFSERHTQRFPPLPSVPGGGAAEAPGREEGARARGDPEGLWGEQQLHQARQGKAGAENGGQQGEPGGPAGCYAGAAAGKGTVVHQYAKLSTE